MHHLAERAHESVQGTIELRGLQPVNYRLRDYEANRDLGTVTGPTAHLAVAFTRHC